MTQDLTIERIPDTGGYDAFADDMLVGTLVFEQAQDRLTHIAAPPGHRDHGYASRLVQSMLEGATARGWTVTSLCPLAASYIRDHPASEQLVDTQHSGRYRLPT